MLSNCFLYQQVRDHLTHENQKLELELETVRLDVERLNGLLDKVQADKRMLGEKLHQVTGRGSFFIAYVLNCFGFPGLTCETVWYTMVWY